MKILRILVLFFLVFSLVPLEAFCQDDHEQVMTDDGHCVLMCHAVCSHALVPGIAVFAPGVPSSNIALSSGSSYQDPTLDTFKRPPVVSA
jgi:hypothetical protein